VALNAQLGIIDSWNQTKPFSGTIVLTALGLTAVHSLYFIAGLPPVNQSAMLSIVFLLSLIWFMLMFGVSILTTLYGYIIEKRPLAD